MCHMLSVRFNVPFSTCSDRGSHLMIVDTTSDCVELQYAAKRRASSTVVDGIQLESLRVMQQDLSGKMICRDRPPMSSVVFAISSDVFGFPESLFRPPTLICCHCSICLELALSMGLCCFEHSVDGGFSVRRSTMPSPRS